jgi:Fic family protein
MRVERDGQPGEVPRRAGAYVRQPEGYRAFIPVPLPPAPALRADDAETLGLLALAERNLGRLDGVTQILPNPDLFVAMYVRKEAVLSSQIEGTQASLEDVIEYEASEGQARGDAGEVVNYVSAMNYGLERLRELPLSLRLIREIHARLTEGVRGGSREPGQFRRSQNWIGPAGALLADAAFVPPPPHEINQALGDLERFIREDRQMPILIRSALVHAQFETIHPFLDGNGRIGRLLITFMLCHAGVLSRPLLYLSYYFKRLRSEYYERLQAVRDTGDWEGWVRFFLTGVAAVAGEAADTAAKIVAMQTEHRAAVQRASKSQTPLRLLDALYQRPVVWARAVAAMLDVSYRRARRAIQVLEGLGLLSAVPGRRRDRRFTYRPYVDLLREGTEPEPASSATTG